MNYLSIHYVFLKLLISWEATTGSLLNILLLFRNPPFLPFQLHQYYQGCIPYRIISFLPPPFLEIILSPRENIYASSS